MLPPSFLVAFLLIFHTGTCNKPKLKQLQPILILDKTQKISSSFSSDTCGLVAPECDPDYKYRSLNGSCNNLQHPTWGMAQSVFTRLFEPRYSDGIELPPLAADGGDLPNARLAITTLLEDEDKPDSVSLIVAQWIQFVAHDFAGNVPKTGESDCCADDVDPLICLSIQVPEDDPWFNQFNKTCLAVTRTETALTGSCTDTGFKTPINKETHFLDGSEIYGSSEEIADKIREYEGGRLTVRTLEDGRNFLPSEGTCYNSKVCYVAGEGRVNQNTQLTVMHTLLVREHNRVADLLQALHPDWSDEILYEEARRIVIAEYQHLTYNEFLPFILPQAFMQAHGLISRQSGYHQYDETIPSSCIVSSTNPGFRVFHSGLQGVIQLYNYILDPTTQINLTDYMNSPQILEEDTKFDQLILGVITQPMQQIDQYYTSQISEKLFHMSSPYGSDLNSLDIQRARDHGTPPYTTILYGCRGIEVDDWDDLADLWPNDKIQKVTTIYKSVHDIDLFIGITFENKEEGHRLSPVMECLIGEQFYRWKNGDRFWYEVEGQPHSFTLEQLEEIKKTSLSRLICDNSDNIVNVTANAWLPASENNLIVPCTTIPGMDLKQWG